MQSRRDVSWEPEAEGRYGEEIARSLHQEAKRRNFIFHLFIIAFEVLMMVSISFRMGGPFAGFRREAYLCVYLILIVATSGVAFAESWLNKREKGHRLYFRIQNTYMVFFCFCGLAITLNDQLGGNGLTVFNYVILILAILSLMKPWKIVLLILANFILLNVLLPYFPDPNGLDNTYNNLMNSAFSSFAAIVIAVNFYNSKIRSKKDEIIIKDQYRQIQAINGLLREEAFFDPLTGLRNRNSYGKAIRELKSAEVDSLACVYIDANGLHELNNRLGHEAGDRMLKTVADILLENFNREDAFRIGGDEFVVLNRNAGRALVEQKIKNMTEDIEKRGYSISTGCEWRKAGGKSLALDVAGMIQEAEAAMQKNKQGYYASGGKERQIRALNQQTEDLMSQKRDAEQFLSVLAPVFKGVYFVDLKTDAPRQLFALDHFAEFLEETGHHFSKAALFYAQRMVKPEHRAFFGDVCDYRKLEQMLEENRIFRFHFEKNDGGRMKLQILKTKRDCGGNKDTLWVFSDLDAEETI